MGKSPKFQQKFSGSISPPPRQESVQLPSMSLQGPNDMGQPGSRPPEMIMRPGSNPKTDFFQLDNQTPQQQNRNWAQNVGEPDLMRFPSLRMQSSQVRTSQQFPFSYLGAEQESANDEMPYNFYGGFPQQQQFYDMGQQGMDGFGRPEQESPSKRMGLQRGNFSQRSFTTGQEQYKQQQQMAYQFTPNQPSEEEAAQLQSMQVQETAPDKPSYEQNAHLSELDQLLRKNPVKKMSMNKPASRKNSQISRKNENSHAISKHKNQPTNVFTKQSIEDLLPKRSRGRPTKLDKDLRNALKQKKFSYQNLSPDLKLYVDKLKSKKKSQQRKQERERRKQSEISHNMETHSIRSRLLSSSTCVLAQSNQKKTEQVDQPTFEPEPKPTEATQLVSPVHVTFESQAGQQKVQKQTPQKELNGNDETTGEVQEENSENTDDEVYLQRHQRAQEELRKQEKLMIKIELEE